MTVTILFTAAFIAASVNAAFVWQDDDDFAKKHDFKFRHANFPPIHQFTFPTFPTFPAFPTFRPLPPIVIPSPEDIAKAKGPNYNGISVSSSSSSTVDKDGKVIQTGGTTVITNNGGVVKKYEFGDDPAQVSVISPPPVVVPQVVQVPQVPIFQHIIPIVPLEPIALKSYKPGDNEHFFGTSSVSFSKSSDINGIKTSSGGTKFISNVDGNVSERSAHFGEHDSPTWNEGSKATETKKISDNEV